MKIFSLKKSDICLNNALYLVLFFVSVIMTPVAQAEEKKNEYSIEELPQEEIFLRINSIFKNVQIKDISCFFDKKKEIPVCYFKNSDKYFFLTGAFKDYEHRNETLDFAKTRCSSFEQADNNSKCLASVILFPSISKIEYGTTYINKKPYEGYTISAQTLKIKYNDAGLEKKEEVTNPRGDTMGFGFVDNRLFKAVPRDLISDPAFYINKQVRIENISCVDNLTGEYICAQILGGQGFRIVAKTNTLKSTSETGTILKNIASECSGTVNLMRIKCYFNIEIVPTTIVSSSEESGKGVIPYTVVHSRDIVLEHITKR